MLNIDPLLQTILAKWRSPPAHRSLLVGLSGIDGSGKGYVAARLLERFREQPVRVALLTVDDWLSLPAQRFSRTDPAGHFYKHGLRLEEMFTRLILPLKETGSVCLDADVADATNAATFRKKCFNLANIDIILLEGIFLFKNAFRPQFDVTVWVDCSFETALQRALTRGQEGLPPEETIRDYQTIYFPAQRLHEERDKPKWSADVVLVNDSRLMVAKV